MDKTIASKASGPDLNHLVVDLVDAGDSSATSLPVLSFNVSRQLLLWAKSNNFFLQNISRRRKLNESRMRASTSASTNIEEEVVDLSSGPIININSDVRRGPNLIYSPGFSNNIDAIQVSPITKLYLIK